MLSLARVPRKAAAGPPVRSTPTSAACVAMIDVPGGSRVYVDTNIWIYVVQLDRAEHAAARALLDGLVHAGCRLTTSELTIAECIYKPAQQGWQASILAFDRLFHSGAVDILPLDGALARRASLHGARTRLKLLDAIHHVSAIESGCRLLVTNDRRFRASDDLPVLTLDP